MQDKLLQHEKIYAVITFSDMLIIISSYLYLNTDEVAPTELSRLDINL